LIPCLLLLMLSTVVIVGYQMLARKNYIPQQANTTSKIDTEKTEEIITLINSKSKNLLYAGEISKIQNTKDRIYIQANTGETDITAHFISPADIFYTTLIFQNYGIVNLSNQLFTYDFETKNLSVLELPEDLKSEEISSINVQQINGDFAFIGFVIGEYALKEGANPQIYLYNSKTRNFERITAMETPCGMYCSPMPDDAIQLGENDFLYLYSGGEGGAGWGQVRILHRDTNTTTDITESSYGFLQGDTVLGFYNSKIIVADRTDEENPSSLIYNSVYLKDPYTGNTQTINGVEEGSIQFLNMDRDTNMLSGYDKQNRRIYYLMEEMSLKEISESAYNEIINSKNENFFIKTEKTITTPKKPFASPTTDSVFLYIIDKDGVSFIVTNIGPLMTVIEDVTPLQGKCVAPRAQSTASYWTEFKNLHLEDTSLYFTLKCVPMQDHALSPNDEVFNGFLGMIDLEKGAIYVSKD